MSENVFDAINAEAPVNAPAGNDAGKKQRLDEMKVCLKKTMTNDPTFLTRLRTLSDSLEVINSIGFGDSGNIVVDHTKTGADGSRALTTTSAIIGYRVRNCGDTPIQYKTEAWVRGEDGRYVAQQVEKVLAPGAYCDLTRQFMTMLCAAPEISFQLKNGKVIRGSGKSKGGNIKAELEAHYFSFAKDSGLQINSDEIKLNAAAKGPDGKWHVKPEFAETFGYMDNEKEKAARASRASGPKLSTSDMAANYIQSLLADSGL